MFCAIKQQFVIIFVVFQVAHQQNTGTASTMAANNDTAENVDHNSAHQASTGMQLSNKRWEQMIVTVNHSLKLFI